jgi:hypothetical protein
MMEMPKERAAGLRERSPFVVDIVFGKCTLVRGERKMAIVTMEDAEQVGLQGEPVQKLR